MDCKLPPPCLVVSLVLPPGVGPTQLNEELSLAAVFRLFLFLLSFCFCVFVIVVVLVVVFVLFCVFVLVCLFGCLLLSLFCFCLFVSGCLFLFVLFVPGWCLALLVFVVPFFRGFLPSFSPRVFAFGFSSFFRFDSKGIIRGELKGTLL